MIWLTVSWRACQTDDDNSTRRRREGKRARRDRARARPALHIHAICPLFSMWSVSMANVSSLFNIFSITRHNIWIQIGLRVLVVRAIVLQRALPPSLAICVIYVLTTFFRSLARSSECTLLRPLAPSSREVLITVASGMRTSWRRPSLPLRTRAHHEPLHAHRCRCFRDGRSTFPFHTDSRTALDKSHLSGQHSRTFYHFAKRVTN